MANVLKRTGIILIVAGALWFCYVIWERHWDAVPEISPVFAAMALAAAFVGLLVFALGEVCRSLQAIEVNTSPVPVSRLTGKVQGQNELRR